MIVGVFFGVLLGGIALMVVNESYLAYKIEQLKQTIKAEKTRSKSRQQEDEQILKEIKADSSVHFCVKAASKHHSKNVKLSSVARKTDTFAAINYLHENQTYHARCIFQYNTNKVTEFVTNKI